MNELSTFASAQPILMLVMLSLALFLTFALVMIPCLLSSPGARPGAIAHTIGCYILKAFALVLIGISSTFVLYYMLTMNPVPLNALLTFAFIFAVGVGIFLHMNRLVAGIDSSVSAVPHAIFLHGCIVIGTIFATLSVLTLVLTVLMTQQIEGQQMPLTLLILSTLFTLAFSLHSPAKAKGGFLHKSIHHKKNRM